MILTLPARIGWKAGRVVGFRRLALVGAGVGIGLLVAPSTGAEMRDRIRREWEKRQTPEPSVPVEPEPGTVRPV
jgi:hypothetical protein